jgi:hypothetical protein
MLFKTKSEADKWAEQRRQGFRQLKTQAKDKKRIQFLNQSIKTIKIKPIKFSDGAKMYKVLGR